MNLLITNQGEQIEDEEGILQRVTRFYIELFQSLGKTVATQLTREELLRYTIATVTPEQRA